MEQNQQQGYKCTGDCLKCSPVQRQYCSSQIAYNNMNLLSDLIESVDEMKKNNETMRSEIDALGKKIEAIQNSEVELINPIEYDDEEETAVIPPSEDPLGHD